MHKFPQPFIIFALLSILFASCSRVSNMDGPPGFYVDESKIPDATPKPEPLAKYGNMPSYNVFGKRYYVMKSVSHYDEVGTASWYGSKFHSRRTSSGEPYNMLSMTAAHKTLPLPTYVEVTNLANQRKIIVKVNDRGPFLCNRIIDLSYVAAKKLGMLGRGTAHVRVKAINPYNFTPTLAKNEIVSKPRAWFVKESQSIRQTQLMYFQVGAFRDKTNAIRLQQKLSSLLATPVKVLLPHSNKLYRVQVGPIKDRISAEILTQRLNFLGIQPSKI